jgi:multidrug resistance efflux pump
MVIILVLYISLIWLLFFKLKWLPWNRLTQWISLIVGVVILSGFLVGLKGLTPASKEAVITGRVVEISPQVSGRVISVNIEPMQSLAEGEVLFEIDPPAYRARVDDLEARLALASLRLEQYQELQAEGAGTGFQLEQSTAEVAQLQAQLDIALFDLTNTKVRAPGPGLVPVLAMRTGMQVSPQKSVMTFVDRQEMLIGARFQQKALQAVKTGDKALINFPALPGRVFESEVVGIPDAIREGQIFASGQLQSVQEQRMTRLWPVMVKIPDDFPQELRKVGLAADVTIHTERAGVVGIVAVILQWISTSLDAVT